MEIHLDLVGGLAGDMFIAALLDAYPQHESTVVQAIASVSGDGVTCSLELHRDNVLQGRSFRVRKAVSGGSPMNKIAHEHATWADIRSRIERAALPETVRTHALAIFGLLADAEAAVHGVPPDKIEFHEVGAWDSLADIIGAATLIATLGASQWTTSPAPLGAGLVSTAHGMLPIPAPATTRLLLGMSTVDDGIPGERVTPTGAAILRYLCPPGGEHEGARLEPGRPARRLTASGTGFGTRLLPGRSNHVRILCFEADRPVALAGRAIDVFEFEVDDQSGEDLATGLDRLRAHPAVLDVTQSPMFGKKGRMMMHVQVLARAHHLDEVADACFRETTTIGLRHRAVQGLGLERRMECVDVDGIALRVKVVERPGGRTAKTESDDVLRHADHAQRAALRLRAESRALEDAVDA